MSVVPRTDIQGQDIQGQNSASAARRDLGVIELVVDMLREAKQATLLLLGP